MTFLKQVSYIEILRNTFSIKVPNLGTHQIHKIFA